MGSVSSIGRLQVSVPLARLANVSADTQGRRKVWSVIWISKVLRELEKEGKITSLSSTWSCTGLGMRLGV